MQSLGTDDPKEKSKASSWKRNANGKPNAMVKKRFEVENRSIDDRLRGQCCYHHKKSEEEQNKGQDLAHYKLRM